MRRRPGVTLIELLVVIGIITTLATLIVAVAPRFGERQRATRGASQLQSWLNLAKARAQRDRKPVGIRIPFNATSAYDTELQFIEIPDEAIGGTITVPGPVSGANLAGVTVTLTTTAMFTPNVTSPSNQVGTNPSALIQAGDVLLIPGFDSRRITAVNGSNGTYQLTLDNPSNIPPPTPTGIYTTTTAYRVLRKARPIVGEAVLQFPKDIALDVSNDPNTPTGAIPSWYRMFPPTANNHGMNPFDILFSPSGQVIGTEGSLGSRICLWVRDVSLGDPSPSQLPPGSNTLITIYTRTGHVTSHPVAVNDPVTGANLLTPGPNWNPFRFTQDGLTSGNGGS